MARKDKNSANNFEKITNDSLFLRTLLSIVLIGVTFHYLNVILKPLFIAVFLYLLIKPFADVLIKWRIPPIISYLFFVLLLGVVSLKVGLTAYQNLDDLSHQIHGYHNQFDLLIKRMAEKFSYNPKVEEIEFSSKTSEKFFDQVFISNLIKYSFGSAIDFMGLLLAVFFYYIFIVFETKELPQRIKLAFSPDNSKRLMLIGDEVIKDVDKYVMLKTGVSLLTALTSAYIMFLFKLKFWILWSMLVFFMNFIPYIGSLIACAFPIFFALLQFQDLKIAALMGALLLGTQVFFGNFLEPYLSGKSLDVSPLALLLLLAYWGWLWGIIGMILAVPLALVIKSILFNFERTKPLAILMSTEYKGE